MPKVGARVKEKKRSQTLGGWAKHAYGSEHQPSNRRQRRRAKQELKSVKEKD